MTSEPTTYSRLISVFRSAADASSRSLSAQRAEGFRGTSVGFRVVRALNFA